MTQSEQPHVPSLRYARLLADLNDREYRHNYATTLTKQFLARQFRAFRGDRSQTEFGAAMELKQSVVSRYENPSYGRQSLETLFDVAEKLDVAVFVRFVDFETFLRLSDDMDDEAILPHAFNEQSIEALILDARVIESAWGKGLPSLAALSAANDSKMEQGMSLLTQTDSARAAQQPSRNNEPARLSELGSSL